MHITTLIYVNDVLLMGNNVNKIKEVKDQLQIQFYIKDLGPLKYFLRIEVACYSEGFVISQRKFTLDILEDYFVLACRPSDFLMEQHLNLIKKDGGLEVDISQYQTLVGRFLYITVKRQCISFSVNQLSHFLSNPQQSYMNGAMRVLHYLKSNPRQGLLLPLSGSLTVCWVIRKLCQMLCSHIYVGLGMSIRDYCFIGLDYKYCKQVTLGLNDCIALPSFHTEVYVEPF